MPNDQIKGTFPTSTWYTGSWRILETKYSDIAAGIGILMDPLVGLKDGQLYSKDETELPSSYKKFLISEDLLCQSIEENKVWAGKKSVLTFALKIDVPHFPLKKNVS